MPASSSRFIAKHLADFLRESEQKKIQHKNVSTRRCEYSHISSARSHRNRLINQLYALHFAAFMHIFSILFIYMSFSLYLYVSVCVLLSVECFLCISLNSVWMRLNTWLCSCAMCGFFFCNNSNKYRCSFVILVLRLDFL